MRISLLDIDNIQSSDFELYREYGMPEYLFVLFKSPAKVLVDGKHETVDKGACIFFDRNSVQHYFPLSGHAFVHDFMHFDIENDLEKLLFSDIPKGKILYLTLPERVSKSLEDIRHELLGGLDKYQREILTYLGMIFLYRIKNEMDQGYINDRKRENYNILHNLRMELYRSPDKEWTIDGICGSIGMSRSYFQHLYKDFFHVSAMEDIINARIELAKLLLKGSNFKIYEIAEKCGYQSCAHFIRQFKKKEGLPPDKFRNK